MMGPRQVDQAALFYEFSLERHVPATPLPRSIDRQAGSINSLTLLICFQDKGLKATWCPGAGSNHRHCDFQSHALPTELPGQVPGRGAAWERRFIVRLACPVHHASPEGYAWRSHAMAEGKACPA
jgi:hypothetical protein